MYEDPNFLIDTGLLPQITLKCQMVLVHFGKKMPAMFFYMSKKTGTMIRESLGMQDLKGPYYDPIGKNIMHRRITLLPNKFPEHSKAILISLFSRGNKIVELSLQKANDLLQQISSKDNLLQPSIIIQEEETPSQDLANDIDVKKDKIQTITIYPPPPAKGGITINTEHYLCLAEDSFLNDVIIDFYLKYLTLEVLSKFDQHRTHVFSSFFYKRLTNPHVQDALNTVSMSLSTKRHAGVRTWTKDVNIFEKDFIIIPINKHAHWFLAIVCFPGLVEEVSTVKTSGNDNNKTVQKIKKTTELRTKTVTNDFTTISPVPITIIDNGSKKNKAKNNDEIKIETDGKIKINQPKENKTEIKLEKQKEIIKKPCILIFDSLSGESRTRVISTLRDYLSCEHVAKLGVTKIFSEDTIEGACLKVPQQYNLADCGLYVLQYVENFFKDPIKDYTFPIQTLRKWFDKAVTMRKREEISNLLIALMNSTKEDKTLINLPALNFPKQDSNLKSKVENQTDIKTAKLKFKNSKRSPEMRNQDNCSITAKKHKVESFIFSK
ncbi:PREDICTED: sentrin-specific protease 7-like [Cyphomyrmex costatus]|uniref:sentrin-specific protease 7-like n=1 Tax=Cyphomyrmex costatus TaxID=456900 RepID=UPI0008524040|nr:PREDICTED: sentrin-specific protease 7-like [Cyphomyrmex costatus]